MSLDLPPVEPGHVWLVGAGPGDPGLLTRLAAHALAQADHVICDALVDDRVLSLAGPQSVIEIMGKRGGQISPTQAAITARLVDLARAGQRVVRLKGGDPFVFGRGAEEALALVDAAIPFRVVPGISSGIGGLAYAGIPVTAKQCNSSLALVTAHGPDGDIPDDVDWAALAQGAQVLVVYMGLRKIAELIPRLRNGGRPGTEAVAVVSRAAQPGQQVLESTLDRVVDDLRHHPMPSPALLVLGGVVELRRTLHWWQP